MLVSGLSCVCSIAVAPWAVRFETGASNFAPGSLQGHREQPLKAALACPVLAHEEAGWDPAPGLGAASDLYLHQLTGCIDDVLRGQDGGGFQL